MSEDESEDWDRDVDFLKSQNNKIEYLSVFSQALIHSNLYHGYCDKNKKYITLTLQEMVDMRYKNHSSVILMKKPVQNTLVLSNTYAD